MLVSTKTQSFGREKMKAEGSKDALCRPARCSRSSTPKARSLSLLTIVAMYTLASMALPLNAQSAVQLSPAAVPVAGEGGVTNLALFGTAFPGGTILPANVDVKLEPAAGGAFVLTKASA